MIALVASSDLEITCPSSSSRNLHCHWSKAYLANDARIPKPVVHGHEKQYSYIRDRTFVRISKWCPSYETLNFHVLDNLACVPRFPHSGCHQDELLVV